MTRRLLAPAWVTSVRAAPRHGSHDKVQSRPMPSPRELVRQMRRLAFETFELVKDERIEGTGFELSMGMVYRQCRAHHEGVCALIHRGLGPEAAVLSRPMVEMSLRLQEWAAESDVDARRQLFAWWMDRGTDNTEGLVRRHASIAGLDEPEPRHMGAIERARAQVRAVGQRKGQKVSPGMAERYGRRHDWMGFLQASMVIHPSPYTMNLRLDPDGPPDVGGDHVFHIHDTDSEMVGTAAALSTGSMLAARDAGGILFGLDVAAHAEFATRLESLHEAAEAALGR